MVNGMSHSLGDWAAYTHVWIARKSNPPHPSDSFSIPPIVPKPVYTNLTPLHPLCQSNITLDQYLQNHSTNPTSNLNCCATGPR